MAETQKSKAAPKKKASVKIEETLESANTETMAVTSVDTEEKETVEVEDTKGVTLEQIDEMVDTVMENMVQKEAEAEMKEEETKALDATIVATSELIKEVHDSTKELETKLASVTPEEAGALIDDQIKHIDETVKVKRKLINPNVTYYWQGCKTY